MNKATGEKETALYWTCPKCGRKNVNIVSADIGLIYYEICGSCKETFEIVTDNK